jgi:hypothetical protein
MTIAMTMTTGIDRIMTTTMGIIRIMVVPAKRSF